MHANNNNERQLGMHASAGGNPLIIVRIVSHLPTSQPDQSSPTQRRPRLVLVVSTTRMKLLKSTSVDDCDDYGKSVCVMGGESMCEYAI